MGYTRSAAIELQFKGIGLSAVCPYYVDTPMTDAAIDRIVQTTGKSAADTRTFLARQNPSGELVTAREVADATYELLVGDATGTVIELLGGGEMRTVEAGIPLVTAPKKSAPEKA